MAGKLPFSVKGLDHLVLRVKDIVASRHFYENVLGCTLERELSELGLYQLRAGAQLIDLVLIGTKLGGESATDISCRNQDHFCINVALHDERDEQDPGERILAYLESHGIEPKESGERYGAEGFGWSVYISDPDENIVEIKPVSPS